MSEAGKFMIRIRGYEMIIQKWNSITQLINYLFHFYSVPLGRFRQDAM